MLKYSFQDLPPFEQDVWRRAEQEIGLDRPFSPQDIDVPTVSADKIPGLERRGDYYVVVESRWE